MQSSELARCSCLHVRRASRLLTKRYNKALAAADLTVAQFEILAHLGEANDSGIPVTLFAVQLGMDHSTLGRNLRPILERRWVASRPDTVDRRLRLVALTPTGLAQLEIAFPFWRWAQWSLEKALGREETLRLNALLKRAKTKISA